MRSDFGGGFAAFPSEGVMITTEMILQVQQLTGRDDLSVTHFEHALRYAADAICIYTNRQVLPPGVDSIWIQMACDIINHMTPSDLGMATPTSIEMDDTKIEGQVNLLNMPNLSFLRDYAKLLQPYRLMKRYRREFYEPIQRRPF